MDPTGHFSLLESIRSLWRNLSGSSKAHYKYQAKVAQRNAAQFDVELKTIKLELAEIKKTKTLEYLQQEATIATQADKIAILTAVNQTLRDKNKQLVSKNTQRQLVAAPGLLGPPIPKRPEVTLASQDIKKDLWDKHLAHLDLAIASQQVRKQ